MGFGEVLGAWSWPFAWDWRERLSTAIDNQDPSASARAAMAPTIRARRFRVNRDLGGAAGGGGTIRSAASRESEDSSTVAVASDAAAGRGRSQLGTHARPRRTAACISVALAQRSRGSSFNARSTMSAEVPRLESTDASDGARDT